MPTVAITGAGGFVCRHITEALLEAGCRVVAIDRAFDDNLRNQWVTRYHQQLDIVESDLGNLPHIGADFLIHGAAITASPEERSETPITNFRANLDPMLDILEWAALHDVRRTFLLSSSAVYRETPSGEVGETLPTTPLGLYAVAKATMEALAETYRTFHQKDVVALRLSFIYGLHESPRPSRPHISIIGRMVEQAFEKGSITVPHKDHPRDWTFAPDVGRAIYHLMQQSTLGYSLYNLASQQVLSSREIAKTIQNYLPHVVLDYVDTPDRLTRLGYLSNQRLSAEIGFTNWTSVDEGIGQIVAARQEALL